VPGLAKEQFDKLVAGAKANCPVSKAYAAFEVVVESAKLDA